MVRGKLDFFFFLAPARLTIEFDFCWGQEARPSPKPRYFLPSSSAPPTGRCARQTAVLPASRSRSMLGAAPSAERVGKCGLGQAQNSLQEIAFGHLKGRSRKR